MSYIGESRKGADRPWESVLCLEKEDCQLLLNAAEKIAIRTQKNYEKWRDIHDGGEMTTRQETSFMKAEEAMEDANALLNNIKAFLNWIERREVQAKQIMEGGQQ